MSAKAKQPKKYRVVLPADPSQGLQLASLVKTPAIGRGWVALSADEPTPQRSLRVKLAAEGGAEQMLYGPLLVPDEEIIRLDPDTKEPYTISFSAETIRAIAARFMQQGTGLSLSNDQHSTPLEGNTITELWIVRDPEVDTAVALGHTGLPAGTLMCGMHIADAEYWETEVLSGNKTGFSIEGSFDFAQLQLAAVEAAPQPMKKNWLFSALVALAAVAGIKLSKVELKNGTIIDVAEDGTVSQLDADGNITGPAADGEYELADGTKLSVKDGKKVGEPAAASSPANQPVAAAADSNVPKAVEWLKKAITLHEQHMSGDAPTTGPDGQASQQEMMDQLDQALAALEGADETQLAEKKKKRPPMKMSAEQVKLAAANLFLEAVPMADGSNFNYNPITRMLTKEDGTMVMTGAYACADGSYFEVSTSQYTYQIDAATYAKANTKLAAVEADLEKTKADLQLAQQTLSTTPAGDTVKLSADHVTERTDTTRTNMPVALSRTEELRARQAAAQS